MADSIANNIANLPPSPIGAPNAQTAQTLGGTAKQQDMAGTQASIKSSIAERLQPSAQPQTQELSR